MGESRRPDEASNVSERIVPTGGIPLDSDRWQVLAPQWEVLHRTIRRLDEVELREVEPATNFSCREVRP